MAYEPDTLEHLFAAFNRMHHNCLKNEFDRRGLALASHPSILFALCHEARNKTASQKELAEFVGISAPTAAISIKRMQKAGLLRKVTDEKDQRKNMITLTDEGLRLVSKCKNVFCEIDMATFKGFSKQEKVQLKGYYLRMIANLEAIGAVPPAQLRRRNGK